MHGPSNSHGVDENLTVSTEEYAKVATKVEVIGVVTNVLLFIFKIVAGIVGNSGAMVSDAIHTASDVFADFIAIIGLQLSKKPEDKKHPYGYEKVECLFTIILGGVLLYVGWEVGSEAVIGIMGYINGNAAAIERPGMIAIIAAVVSIVSKELLFRYVIGFSKRLNSPTLKATAWHHRSDSLSSIGALLGIVGAFFGITVLDAIASLLICIIVVKIGLEVLVSSIKNLTDAYAGDEVDEEIVHVCDEVGAKLIESKSRLFGHMVYVEVTIGCDENMTVKESHAIAEAVHEELEHHLSNVKHVTVHVDPIKA